jgi:hypothetical protein
MSPKRRRLVVVTAFVVAAFVAGVAGALLEQVTGLWWTRYVLAAVVIVVAVVAVLRPGATGLSGGKSGSDNRDRADGEPGLTTLWSGFPDHRVSRQLTGTGFA